MDLSPLGITDTSGDTAVPFTVPGIENLQDTLTTITIASIVLGLLFIVLYAANLIHRIRADHAMIAMQKDIAAIKQLLEQHAAPAATQAPPQQHPDPTVHIDQPPTRGESEGA